MNTEVRESGGWRRRAECRSEEPELFFPAAESGPAYRAQVAAAKAICARCPVRPDCLAEALARIPFGIAGGLTPEERRGLATRSGAAPASPEDRARVATSHAEAAEAGLAMLGQGRATRSVARLCGVSERTVLRWAADARRTGVPA